jgi:hypothetical protein
MHRRATDGSLDVRVGQGLLDDGMREGGLHLCSLGGLRRGLLALLGDKRLRYVERGGDDGPHAGDELRSLGH